MDVISDHEQRNPKRLKALACSAKFPHGNILLHKFVLDNSNPNVCVQESCLKAVLRSMSDAQGGTVNAVNDNGYTALHLSVLKENLVMVKGLLSYLKNIDVDAPCAVGSLGDITVNCGSTALHLAAEAGNLAIVQELCNNGAAIDVENRIGETALYVAAEYGHLDTMKLLVSKGADVNAESVAEADAPLSGAASLRGNLEAVKYLVECGANVNPISKTAPLCFAVKSGDAAIVEFLISNGAEVVDDALLYFSIMHGRIEIVECLLRGGADVNASDEFTPLHLAVSEGRSEMATLLLDRGANANIRDNFNLTALHLAASQGKSEMATLLLERGGDVNARDDSSRTPLHVAVNKRCSILAEFTGILVSRVKADAARRKKIEMAELLVEQGADFLAIDEEGRTPLYDAVCGKNDEWIRVYDKDYRESAKLIRTLVEKGADLNARDEEGRTPLDYTKINLRIHEVS